MSGLHTLVLRLRASGFLLRHPASLANKLRRVWRGLRAAGRYRQKLQQGTYLPPIGAGGQALSLSLVMPVFRVPEAHLEAAIASVRQQSFADFQFLLLDDASPDPHVARILERAAREDGRIHLLTRRTTGGISVASNQLVGQAKGEFVAFVDHDDLLHPQALAAIAQAAQLHPDADWFFTDEDKLDPRGRHGRPCFKLGFSHHLLLCWNHVSHLRVVRRNLILQLGGHRPGLEGAQDWDLALRVLAAGGRFCHVRGVLYHWRESPRSMAASSYVKAQANLAARRALEEHLAFMLAGCTAAVEPLVPGRSLFRTSWVLPDLPPLTVLLLPGEGPGPWPAAWQRVWVREPLAKNSWIEATEAAAHALLLRPTPGMTESHVHSLVARVLLPGTAAAAGRFVGRWRVRCSGWLADSQGRWRDPLARLSLTDPGYCNLALMPQPRTLLPPQGWVARRRVLREALEQASGVSGPWLASYALAQAAGEKVVVPEVSLPAKCTLTPPLPPGDLGEARWPFWAEELGLFP